VPRRAIISDSALWISLAAASFSAEFYVTRIELRGICSRYNATVPRTYVALQNSCKALDCTFCNRPLIKIAN